MTRFTAIRRHAAVSARLALACCAGGVCAPALGAEPASTSLTIYSSAQPGAVPPELYRPTAGGYNPYGNNYAQTVPGFAIVRSDRTVSIDAGTSTLRFTDVAELIDPTTVAFSSLTHPDSTSVLEQNFEFDLVSSQKLLERFIDKKVTFSVPHGDTVEEVSGTLLSTTGGTPILRTADGSLRVLNSTYGFQVPPVTDRLITRPTLVWTLATRDAGEHRVRVSYETKGITWWADYNLVYAEGDNANAGTLDVGAWVSILNQSGATYQDAKLKLIAGDVHRAPQQVQTFGGISRRAELAMDEAAAGFAEKSFFEYHLYTLGRPTTIGDNSTKQVELFPTARGVACDKVLVYAGQELPQYWNYSDPYTDQNYGVQSKKDVNIYLRFRNDKEHSMGMPLPAGRIRVSKLDAADGSLEFIGEDVIDHTPRNEEVMVRLGNAFDVVGERKQTDFRVDTSRRWMRETYEIEVRNHKDVPVQVIIQERLYRWSNWEIEKPSQDFKKLDSRTIQFPVQIDKDGTAKVTYSVVYTW